MPRGPVDRPPWSRDPYLEIRSAIDRALMQGAAPVAALQPQAEPPRFEAGVQGTSPARRTGAVSKTRAARSFAPAKKKGRREPDRVPDPAGRGTRIDLRV